MVDHGDGVITGALIAIVVFFGGYALYWTGKLVAKEEISSNCQTFKAFQYYDKLYKCEINKDK